MKWLGPISCLALLAGCSSSGGTTVQHRAVPQVRAMEHFSISSIEIRYRSGLSPEQKALIANYRPGEQVATKIQAWAEETGMWGGLQGLMVEVHSLWLHEGVYESYQPREQWDRLGASVEIRQGDRVLHRMEVMRTAGTSTFALRSGGSQSIGEILSSDRAMDGLIAEVAWQIVYEMTPPGYDEAVIRAGYRDQVRTATTIAAGRGFLSQWEFQKASWALQLTHEEAYLEDYRCGLVLSKPGWMPWWLHAFPRLGFYKRCEARAADAEKRE